MCGTAQNELLLLKVEKQNNYYSRYPERSIDLGFSVRDRLSDV